MALIQARADPQAESQNAEGLAAVISNIDEAKAKKEKADKEAQAQAQTELARVSKNAVAGDQLNVAGKDSEIDADADDAADEDDSEDAAYSSGEADDDVLDSSDMDS